MKRAFTLIELLVVIAIIAILAAILFPVFAQAKAAAKKTQALSNTKQTYTGVLIYLGDSDDTYPMGVGPDWWGPSTGNWIEATKPYIKSVPILRDPSDSLQTGGWPSWFLGSGIVPISFAANGWQQWTSGTGWAVFGLMGMNQSSSNPGGGWMGRCITNASSVTTPAETVALAERFGSHTIFGPGNFFDGVDGWGWDTAPGISGLIPDGSKTATSFTTADWKFVIKNQQFGGVTPAYGDKIATFAYADGHAKAIDPRSTNPNPSTQPQNNQWNAFR